MPSSSGEPGGRRCARRIGFANHADGVGADQLAGSAHGLEEVGVVFRLSWTRWAMASVSVSDSIRSPCPQLAAQFFEVFDDAVVHHGQPAGDVRVGVALGGHAVGGPAGVGDADVGGAWRRIGLRGKFGDAPTARRRCSSGRRSSARRAGGIVARYSSLRRPSSRTRGRCCDGQWR